MERRTVAPAPSDCSRANSTVLMALGLGDAAFNDGSSGGMTGRPTNAGCAAIVEDCLRFFASLLKVFVRKKDRIYSNRVSCW